MNFLFNDFDHNYCTEILRFYAVKLHDMVLGVMTPTYMLVDGYQNVGATALPNTRTQYVVSKR